MIRARSILASSVVVVSACAMAVPAHGAHTLVSSQTQIDGFAQDGRFIAWSSGEVRHFPCGRTVTVRNLVTGTQRAHTLRPTPCFFGIALARRHGLTMTPPTICGNCFGATVWTFSLGRAPEELATFAESPEGGGHRLSGVAGDRRLRVLSWVGYNIAAGDACLDDETVPCTWKVSGGRVVRIVDDKQVRVPGVAPAIALAVGGGRVATAPAVATWQDGFDSSPRPAEDGPVHVMDAATGAPVITVSPMGTVRALALSADKLAVLLERGDGTHAIERYAVPSGTLLAATSVGGAARDLDISGKWIVYRSRRQIELIGPAGVKHLLTVAEHRPLNVSIEGTRVAWAENGGGQHRIRAATVPH